MTKYLGELTAREFARDHLVTVTGLRLGELYLRKQYKRRHQTWRGLISAMPRARFRCVLNRDSSNSGMVDTTVGGLSYLCGYPQSEVSD